VLATQKRSTRKTRSAVRFSRDAKKTLELALRQALRMQHNYIGTEHLLLGIMQQDKDPATSVLGELKIEPEATEKWFEDQIEKILGGHRGGRAVLRPIELEERT
jgi:ATP-dependent Clp protease ATP-binding subunit ClpA